MDHGSVPLCSVLTPLSLASGHSKNNEDLKQHNSELEEKLRLLVIEKSAMQLGMEELQKKLEMSELLLQQVGLKPWGVGDPPGRARASRGHCGALQPGTRKFGSLFWFCHRLL